MTEKLTRRQALKVAGATALGGLAISAISMPQTVRAAAASGMTVNLQLVVVPDFRGSGWDSFVPTQMVVHQGDNVDITIFNADTMPHGFGIDDLSINQPIPAATKAADGTITPSVTDVKFQASKAGALTFKCTVNCEAGHETMVGTLLVL
jgi:heme/copper-type cytochrome/quinol oxidase subunit 2